MDTNPAPTPKDKAQQLFKLGIYSLDYRVLGLFLYIVAIKYFNQYLRRPYKALKKGIKAYKKIQFQQTVLLILYSEYKRVKDIFYLRPQP